MHEWHITQELLDQICTQAKENHLGRISKIQVELGKNSHLTEESLLFCFQALSKGTIAEGAELQIRLSEGNSLTLMSIVGEQTKTIKE